MVTFDIKKFARAIRVKAAAEGLQHQEVAVQSQVSPSTISRITKQQQKPDLDKVAKLLTWLNMPFEDFITKEER